MTLKKLDSLESWHRYYVNNAVEPDGIPWETAEELTAQERRCIKDSIAAFQLGEYSEGRGLKKFADEYSRNFDDDYLTKITRLFIGEEQNHALLLKRFMSIHGLCTIQSNWTDTVFRRLRKNVSYEWSITVLIVAEIIALVYYKALRACTKSIVLQEICNKILADETEHVKYESELINCIRNSNPKLKKWLMISFHRFLFSGTVIVVYFAHMKVLNRGGYTLFGFWYCCFREFNQLFRQKISDELAADSEAQ
jgi:hypothetical protein